jgi:dihydrofolate synthase/folylpolyglutamate synthase
MTESILRAAGYRTGLYTSPYIKEFNERMRVCGENISNEELVELTALIRPIAERMEDKPTEFELITAIAFLYFKRHNCDVVILEVGLGGRLDSTNIVTSPLLSVVTGIDFDHTDLLGDTIEKIAAEKGGIIKSGCPVLYGGTDPAAHTTLFKIAAQKGSDFHTVDHQELQVNHFSIDGTSFDFGNLKSLNLPLLGTYQPRNASTVLTAIEILNQAGTLCVPEAAIRQGLSSVVWHARFEKLNESDPIMFFDGSHNPQGIAAATETVKVYFKDQAVTILTGVMRDKNYEVMIRSIREIAHHVITVTPSNPRSLPAEEYAEHFRAHGVSATSCTSVEDGAKAAIAIAKETHTPLVCLGSLYLYGELTDAIKSIQKDGKSN